MGLINIFGQYCFSMFFTFLIFYTLLPLYTSRSLPNKDEPGENAKEQPTDQIPLPEWDRYLKSVSKITLNEKNKEYKEFLKDINLREKFKEDGSISDETLHQIQEAFEKMIPEEDKKLLHAVKKKEIDAYRRRLIPTKKQLANDQPFPTHLNFTVLPFTAQDIGLLIRANMEHVKKFQHLRETDFAKYEMEKRFLEEQRLRHIKTEERRKKELEQLEAEKAKRAAANVKHPMSEDAEKDVWEDKEGLPRDEFNPKTFFSMHDLDSNGLLDLEEVRVILRQELENSKIDKNDTREYMEEMERMRDHIYRETDKNGDLMIDFEEFEKQRLNEIRDDMAEGKKPKGYNYEDVPLLDDNFLNETHIRYGGVLMKVDDSPHDVREKVFKEYAMKKQFEEEQYLNHIEDPLKRRKKEIEKEIQNSEKMKIHEPLSPEQQKATWKEQDHKDESEYEVEKFYNLHDINGDKLIDRQELRMMVITELTDSYKKANRSVESEDFSEDLERIREEVFEKADTDKDGLINKSEFLAIVALNQKKHEERVLHQESDFSEDEYNKFRDEKVLEIRKMIADGILPENYNYTDVPLLSGNFINATHIQRNGVMVEIHTQTDRKQKVQDFKRFRMEARFKYEHKVKNMSHEEQKKEKERLAQIETERHEKHKNIARPMSETQEKEVWEEEDKMEPEEFSLEKYFKLHDVDSSGKWSKQEVTASLIQQLDKMYNLSDPSTKDKREAEMESWLEYVYSKGDLDKDGEIDFIELTHLERLAKENRNKNEDDWKDIEDEDEYTDDEWEKIKHEHSDYD